MGWLLEGLLILWSVMQEAIHRVDCAVDACDVAGLAECPLEALAYRACLGRDLIVEVLVNTEEGKAKRHLGAAHCTQRPQSFG